MDIFVSKEIISIIEIVAVLLCINYMYSSTIRLGIADAMFLAVQATVVICANYIKDGKSIIILSYIVIYVFIRFKFRTSNGHSFAYLMLLTFIMVVLQLVCSAPSIFISDYIDSIVLVVVDNLVVLILIILAGMRGILYKTVKRIMKYDCFTKISVVCCCVGIVYIIVVYKMDRYLRPTDYIIFCAWTIIIIYTVIQWQKTKELYRIKEKEVQVAKIYERYSNELLETVIRKQHDFDNHIQAILGHTYTAESLEQLLREQQAYISDINNDNQFNKLLAGGNSLIIGFLYSKFENAKEQGCHITYRVNTDSMECKLPKYKIIEVIGILIDNSVEAALDNNTKEIEVEITETDSNIRINISNPYEYVTQDTISEWLSEGVSSKGKERGIGLANVVRTVEEYGIEFAVYCEEINEVNYVVFNVMIEK